MVRVDHLRLCLIEECDEISQRMTKLMRFGPNEVQPEQSLNNTERLVDELNDLMGVIELLIQEGALPLNWVKLEKVNAKKLKVEKFLLLSKQCGTLVE
jgi:NTP pyrophosphatase (non-canonical NTP hydrolase)